MKNCLVCDNGIMEDKPYTTMIYIPFCTEVRQLLLKGYKCNLCESEIGDDENDDRITKTVDILTKKSVKFMVIMLKRRHSFSGMERVLGLPLGTFKKWYNEEEVPTPGELTLLRLLTYDKNQAILRIAENKFR